MDLSTALAKKVNADVVLANDPDADHLAVMAKDAEGRLQMLTGNEVGVLLGHYLLTQKKPKPAKPLVITTIVSSVQLGQIAQALGALYDERLTGFKWIANCALEREAREGATFLFGYEEALGYTVGTVARDKDGIGAALVFCDLAAWCHARGRWREDAHRVGKLEAGLALVGDELDLFAGQRPFDEDGLAVDMRDAAAFLVERFDPRRPADRFRLHAVAVQPDRNSRQCGSCDLPSVARTRSHSRLYCASSSRPRTRWKRWNSK